MFSTLEADANRNGMLEIRKYTFSVEGETERWYFEWLRDVIFFSFS